MTNHKKLIFLFICSFIPINSALAGTAETVKSITKIGTGAGLALIAHVITEYPIVYTHETGHRIGSLISGGSKGEISIECLLREHPLAILFPFKGGTLYAKDSIPKFIGGPIAGISACYSTIIAASMIHSKYLGQSLKQGFTKGAKMPFSIYGIIAKYSENLINGKKNCPTILGSFATTFAILKSGKLLGEFLYGMTPFSIEYGDGQKLWKSFGWFDTTKTTVKPLTGLAMATAPTIIAGCYGLAKGLYRRFWS